MRLFNRMIVFSIVMVLAAAGATAVRYPDAVRAAISPYLPLETAPATDVPAVAEPLVVITRAPIDTISEGPAVSIAGLDRQFGINSRDLEISNVRLGGKGANSSGTAYTSGMKLALVATDVQFEFQRPSNPRLNAQVEGVFSMTASADFGDHQPENTTFVVASATLEPEDFRIPQISNLTIPRLAKRLAERLSLPVQKPLNISGRLANLEQKFLRPNDYSALDQSPFGIVCTPTFTATVLPGAMVRLKLSSPCHPYTTVIISHGRLKFAERTSHTGALDVLVPALNTDARFSAVFENGWKLHTSTTVAEVKSIMRVAILWDGAYDLNLNAYEFGASDGTTGHVNAARPRSIPAATSYGGGYIVRLGDGSLSKPKQAEIYSYPLGTDTKSGTVRLIVQAFADKLSCDQSAKVTSLRSADGQVVAASSLRFVLPGCDNAAVGALVVNAVRDLNVK